MIGLSLREGLSILLRQHGSMGECFNHRATIEREEADNGPVVSSLFAVSPDGPSVAMAGPVVKE